MLTMKLLTLTRIAPKRGWSTYHQMEKANCDNHIRVKEVATGQCQRHEILKEANADNEIRAGGYQVKIAGVSSVVTTHAIT